jgi:hypothetical protein
MDIVYQTQTNIADSSKDFQMQKAAFDQEVNTRKAEAELSYELQVNVSTVFFYLILQQVLNTSSKNV